MKKNKGSLFEKRAKYGYIFILPLILGVIFIFLPNLVQTFGYSVSDIRSGSNIAISFSGFSRYKEAFASDPKFVPYLVDNLKKLLINVPVILIYSLFISTLLNQKFKGRILARIIFFIPVILSTGVLSQMDDTALYYTGAGQMIDTGITTEASELFNVSSMLTSLNFPEVLIEIVVNAVSNIYYITRSSGIQIYIFLAALQEIPSSIYEAASIEGCSKWELFWKITFPMIAPQIGVNAVYTIAMSATENNTLLDYSNNLAFGENQYSLATAMNVIYLLTLAVFVLIVLAILKKFSSNTEG